MLKFFFRILYKKIFSGDIRLLWKSLFRENVITITDKTTNYIDPNNYQDLNPNTNSNYLDLKPNTNYQELKVQYGEENQYQTTTLWKHKIYWMCLYINDRIIFRTHVQIKCTDKCKSRLLILIFRNLIHCYKNVYDFHGHLLIKMVIWHVIFFYLHHAYIFFENILILNKGRYRYAYIIRHVGIMYSIFFSDWSHTIYTVS